MHSWEVEATLLKTTPGDSDAPECLAGALAGPPEDCGGIPGFWGPQGDFGQSRRPRVRVDENLGLSRVRCAGLLNREDDVRACP